MKWHKMREKRKCSWWEDSAIQKGVCENSSKLTFPLHWPWIICLNFLLAANDSKGTLCERVNRRGKKKILAMLRTLLAQSV